MAVSKFKETNLPDYIGHVTSLLALDENAIIIAGDKTIYTYNIDEDTLIIFHDGCKYIPDMTKMNSNKFAAIDQGTWSYSNICIFNTKDHTKNTIRTDTHCSGIAYRDNHFFLTFSASNNFFLTANNISNGYVKMINTSGQVKKKIAIDTNGQRLFSGQISKIFVTSDFCMYVADIGKSQLQSVKINAITGTASCDSEWDSMVVNCILYKNNKLILALGGDRDEIVCVSPKGSKIIINNRYLHGVPTAVCYIDSLLAVATAKKAWWYFWKAQNRIEIFQQKDDDSCSNDHVIVM